MHLIFDDSLKTGITDIDIQHNFLFEAINSLETIDLKSNDLLFTLYNIEEYALNHFKTEEEYMYKYKYPDIVEHIIQHKNFSLKYNVLKKEFEEKGLTKECLMKLRFFLSNWIIEHYTTIDVKMAKFIKNCI